MTKKDAEGETISQKEIEKLGEDSEKEKRQRRKRRRGEEKEKGGTREGKSSRVNQNEAEREV